MSVEIHLKQLHARIAAACDKYGRDADTVNLLAVSKTKPVEMVQEAASAGQQHFAENYLQDALTKIDDTKPLNLTWHFVGAVQSNKTRQIAENFDWVHTVSSLKIAKRLSAQRPPGKQPLNVLLQVNIDDEPTKSGLPASEVSALAAQAAQLDHIRLRGLMIIPRPGQTFDQQRATFGACAKLKQDVQAQLNCTLFDQLSMGMSGDLEAAIAEGATWVRIGTAIFGKRD